MKKTKEMAVLAFLVLLVAGWQLASCDTAAGSDLVGHWTFDEGQGSIAHDSSGNALDGVVIGASWSEGILGSGLEFQPGSLVDVTDGGSFPFAIGDLTAGSVSMWFKLALPLPGPVLLPLFYVGDGFGSDTNSSLVVEIGHKRPGGTELFFTIYDEGAVPQCFDSGFHLTVGTWYHFVAVVGENFNTGYLNGIEMEHRHYNAGDPSDHYFSADVLDEEVCWIGAGFPKYAVDMHSFGGIIDEVRVYDGPLTAAEVLDHYQSVRSVGNSLLLRGDADGDGVFNALVDAMYLLTFGFAGGPPPPCLEATDADDDAMQNALADSLYILTHGFMGGPAPAAPYPACGNDPDPAGSLGCDVGACP